MDTCKSPARGTREWMDIQPKAVPTLTSEGKAFVSSVCGLLQSAASKKKNIKGKDINYSRFPTISSLASNALF